MNQPFIVGKWPTGDHRSHTISHKKPFYLATATWIVTWLLFALFLASVIYCIEERSIFQLRIVGTLMVTSCISLIVCLLVRKSCRCPLCRGHSMVDGRSRKHAKAFKIRPLSYHSTAFITILLKGRYRCQHCGTPFVMNKKKENTSA